MIASSSWSFRLATDAISVGSVEIDIVSTGPTPASRWQWLEGTRCGELATTTAQARAARLAIRVRGAVPRS